MTDFKTQLTAIFDLQSGSRLDAFVKAAREFSPEEFQAALPSTQMGPDGPVLVRVMLVSESYIVDLHMGSVDLEFDFALRKMQNYRVALGEVTVKVKEEERRYQTARIQLLSLGGMPTLHTELTYVGLDRASWLTQVREALPVATLLSD